MGDDADVSDGGDEIDVAVPAWDDVCVYVSGHACTGAAADVEADVVALRVHGELQGFLAEYQQFHQLGAFLGCAFGEHCGVAVGGCEQMAVDVGIAVEHEEAVRGTGEDEVCFVVFR